MFLYSEILHIKGYNIVGSVNSKRLEYMLKCLLGGIIDFNYKSQDKIMNKNLASINYILLETKVAALDDHHRLDQEILEQYTCSRLLAQLKVYHQAK